MTRGHRRREPRQPDRHPRREEPEPDLARLTAAQKERMAEFQPRYLELGLEELTDDELEDLAAIAEILKAADAPMEARP